MRLERTLPTVWQLRGFDVPALAPVVSRGHVIVLEDVEYLCSSVVVDTSDRDESYIPSETSDLYEGLGFLLGRVIEVLPRYDPTKGRRIHDPWTGGFKAWLHDELTYDLIDQWRSWFGRNGQKRLPGSFVDQWGEEENLAEDNIGRAERIAGRRNAATQAAGDRGHSGLDALRGLLEGGDRTLLREVEALGLGSAAGARGRAARADRGDARDDLARVA